MTGNRRQEDRSFFVIRFKCLPGAHGLNDDSKNYTLTTNSPYPNGMKKRDSLIKKNPHPGQDADETYFIKD